MNHALIKPLLLVVTFTTLLLLASTFQNHLLDVISWVKSQGYWAPLFFILIYCCTTTLMIPTMMLTLAGGAIFGLFEGTIFNLIGASCGACCSFLVSRYWVSPWLDMNTHPKYTKLLEKVEKKGWVCLAFFRLFPLLPFSLVNYGMGMTNMSFAVYTWLTVIFLLPAEIVYTYCGHAGIQLMSHHPEAYSQIMTLFISGFIGLFFAFKIIKACRKNLGVSPQNIKKSFRGS